MVNMSPSAGGRVFTAPGLYRLTDLIESGILPKESVKTLDRLAFPKLVATAGFEPATREYDLACFIH